MGDPIKLSSIVEEPLFPEDSKDPRASQFAGVRVRVKRRGRKLLRQLLDEAGEVKTPEQDAVFTRLVFDAYFRGFAGRVIEVDGFDVDVERGGQVDASKMDSAVDLLDMVRLDVVVSEACIRAQTLTGPEKNS